MISILSVFSCSRRVGLCRSGCRCRRPPVHRISAIVAAGHCDRHGDSDSLNIYPARTDSVPVGLTRTPTPGPARAAAPGRLRGRRPRRPRSFKLCGPGSGHLKCNLKCLCGAPGPTGSRPGPAAARRPGVWPGPAGGARAQRHWLLRRAQAPGARRQPASESSGYLVQGTVRLRLLAVPVAGTGARTASLPRPGKLQVASATCHSETRPGPTRRSS